MFIINNNNFIMFIVKLFINKHDLDLIENNITSIIEELISTKSIVKS